MALCAMQKIFGKSTITLWRDKSDFFVQQCY